MHILWKWTNELQWENMINEYTLKHWGNIKILFDEITSQTKDLWINVHGMDNRNNIIIFHEVKYEWSPPRMERRWRETSSKKNKKKMNDTDNRILWSTMMWW